MGASRTQAFPAGLESLRRRFKKWRRARKIGSRIPEPLWSEAVKLAEAHGIHPTSKAAGVDYYSLKKRLEGNSASGSRMASAASGPTFVEVPAVARTGIPECILELENVEGAKMRIHFKRIEAPDLAALSRSLWGTE